MLKIKIIQTIPQQKQIVEFCGIFHIFLNIVEFCGFYRYKKPVLLWRGKGKIEVFASGCTCFMRNCS